MRGSCADDNLATGHCCCCGSIGCEFRPCSKCIQCSIHHPSDIIIVESKELKEGTEIPLKYKCSRRKRDMRKVPVQGGCGCPQEYHIKPSKSGNTTVVIENEIK